MPMTVRRIECHPAVTENTGRIALMRGPLLYCAEETDNPDLDLLTAMLSASEKTESRFESELLDGVTTLSIPVETRGSMDDWKSELYRTVDRSCSDAPVGGTLKLIPYYAWANREPGPMRVWIRRQESL